MARSDPQRTRKPRLGRGLSSLIPTPSAPQQAADADDHQYAPEPPPQPHETAPTPPDQSKHPGARDVPIDRICPNPHQPRREFDPTALAELTDSIRQQGVLQPLLVAPADADGRFVLVAGERRLRAARDAGLSAVPCAVRAATAQQMLEWALIENIQRTDLNPIERAEAYRQYLDRFGLTQADAAERLGQARATVANYLRMLDLHSDVQQMVAEGRLSFGHARALAGLLNAPDRQLALAKRALNDGLSVRHVEKLVAQGAAPSAEPPARSRTTKPAYLRDVEERLTRAVGTKVSVQPGRRKHSGRITVEYYSLDDFDRIAAALGLGERS